MTRGQRVIAGLQVKWRELAGSKEGEAGPGVWVVHDPDALLDELTQDEFERTDQRMPYFGELWPSAESLVTRLLAGPRLDGTHVLDLGCGLGPCGLAAAWQGAQVTFFDWEPRALEIVAASVRENEGLGERCAFVVGDWRDPPPLGPFDLILGADVLYERRNAPAVADFLAAHLVPAAEAWITDQGRPEAEQFPTFALDADLDILGTEILPPEPHGLDITLLRIRRPV